MNKILGLVFISNHDTLNVVFLGGEVVVDYAIRLKKLYGSDVFIAAYANDVMASKRGGVLRRHFYAGLRTPVNLVRRY